MNETQIGDVLAISISIKFITAAVFTILEEKDIVRNPRIESSIFVLSTALICVLLYAVGNFTQDDAFNIFFYTLGIDNIANYTKLGLRDIMARWDNRKNGRAEGPPAQSSEGDYQPKSTGS